MRTYFESGGRPLVALPVKCIIIDGDFAFVPPSEFEAASRNNQREGAMSSGRSTHDELAVLRLSIRRVAEATGNPAIIAYIPPQGAQRGWNQLCAVLLGYIAKPGGAS